MSSLPQTLGQYQIIREIARSNDVVYEGYDPVMCRRVAIKELAIPQGSTSSQEEQRFERFKREAQAAGTLNHPNIMTVYSFAEEAGHTFMAMEYLDGRTLRNELDTKGGLPQDQALDIIQQVLAGLEHAHTHGVIHRDIKPDNIQLTSSGVVKITDFGIARLTFQPNLTQDGQVFGTPSYMSPEQIQGREIDARSDLFSSAVMLYEMLSGSKPFMGDSIISITHSILNSHPNMLATVPYSLWQVIERGLDKSPQLRYSSASEFSGAIERATTSVNDFVVPDVGGYQSSFGQPPQNIVPPPIIQPYAPGVFPNSSFAPQGQPPQLTYSQSQPHMYSQPYTPGFGPQSGIPGQVPFGNPNQVFPAYYPPPPRTPLFKSETVDFYRRLALTFLIIGTLFVLVIVAVKVVSTEWQRAVERRHDQGVSVAGHGVAQSDPSDQIRRLKAVRDQMQGAEGKAQVDRQVAMEYEDKAKSFMKSGNKAEAEAFLENAIKADAYNPRYDNDLAGLYYVEAKSGFSSDEQAPLFGKAGDEWIRAANKETDSLKAETYRQWGVTAYTQYSEAIINTGDPSLRPEARDRLRRAQSHLSGDSQLEGTISGLIQDLD